MKGRGPLLALVTAAAMEPVAAAVHRFVGHGIGWGLHRDHHERDPGETVPHRALERNDAIPAFFALVAMGVMARSVASPRRRRQFWVATGTSLYGVAYALVHDVYVHRRVGPVGGRVRWLEAHRRAHEQHHDRGGPPFGMLVPITVTLRRRRGRLVGACRG